jgi:hypothetical protein
MPHSTWHRLPAGRFWNRSILPQLTPANAALLCRLPVLNIHSVPAFAVCSSVCASRRRWRFDAGGELSHPASRRSPAAAFNVVLYPSTPFNGSVSGSALGSLVQILGSSSTLRFALSSCVERFVSSFAGFAAASMTIAFSSPLRV